MSPESSEPDLKGDRCLFSLGGGFCLQCHFPSPSCSFFLCFRYKPKWWYTAYPSNRPVHPGAVMTQTRALSVRTPKVTGSLGSFSLPHTTCILSNPPKCCRPLSLGPIDLLPPSFFRAWLAGPLRSTDPGEANLLPSFGFFCGLAACLPAPFYYSRIRKAP